MKVFVTGVAGQLGHDVINELSKRGIECVGSDLAPEYAGAADGSAVTTAPYVSLDITDEKAVAKALAQVYPSVVIHCAAWTAVDAAEDEDKQAKVHAINVDGTANLAAAAAELDAKFVYISTDYVFDGQGSEPWLPDCKDYAPLNVYGSTKLEGEKAVAAALDKFFIVRIAWVFGTNGKNFIKTMLRVGATHDRLTVVNDQIGTPTYTLDLSVLLADMIATDKYGYYHATNAELVAANEAEEQAGFSAEGTRLGYISWCDFTKEIFRLAVEVGHEEYARVEVAPVTTAEYGISKAARPFNSRLDKAKLVEAGFTPLPTWQDAVRRYIAELDFTDL